LALTILATILQGYTCSGFSWFTAKDVVQNLECDVKVDDDGMNEVNLLLPHVYAKPLGNLPSSRTRAAAASCGLPKQGGRIDWRRHTHTPTPFPPTSFLGPLFNPSPRGKQPSLIADFLGVWTAPPPTAKPRVP
jgi:hypothetical protein